MGKEVKAKKFTEGAQIPMLKRSKLIQNTMALFNVTLLRLWFCAKINRRVYRFVHVECWLFG